MPWRFWRRIAANVTSGLRLAAAARQVEMGGLRADASSVVTGDFEILFSMASLIVVLRKAMPFPSRNPPWHRLPES
jgi:hypothetical protein